MFTFTLIILSFLVADLIFWNWLDARLRMIGHPRLWRSVAGLFFAIQLLYLGSAWVHGWWHELPDPIPMQWSVAAYLWHFCVLPVTLLGLSVFAFGQLTCKFLRR